MQFWATPPPPLPPPPSPNTRTPNAFRTRLSSMHPMCIERVSYSLFTFFRVQCSCRCNDARTSQTAKCVYCVYVNMFCCLHNWPMKTTQCLLCSKQTHSVFDMHGGPRTEPMQNHCCSAQAIAWKMRPTSNAAFCLWPLMLFEIVFLLSFNNIATRIEIAFENPKWLELPMDRLVIETAEIIKWY